MVRLLPDIQSLDLDTLDATVAITRVLEDNLPGVQALSLTRVHLKDIGVLYALFLSFPQLRELQLVDVFLIHATASRTVVPPVDRATDNCIHHTAFSLAYHWGYCCPVVYQLADIIPAA